MGYIKHNAIVVMAWDEKYVIRARDEAIAIGKSITDEVPHRTFDSLVGPVVHGIANGYCGFTIYPDGSKEGWDTSDNGDEFLARVKNKFQELARGDCYLDWIEVAFGGDFGAENNGGVVVDDADRYPDEDNA